MLEYIRRQNVGIKIVLGLVVLSFIIFYAGSFSGLNRHDPSRHMADVAGEQIGFVEYQNMFNAMLQEQRQFYQGREESPEMINMLRQQAINTLVDRKLVLKEAKKTGVTSSEDEVRRYILKSPYFTENGSFVGMEEYNRRVEIVFHMDVPSFEKMISQDVIINKFNHVLTAGILVSDQEVEDQYRKTNLTAKIDYVLFEKDMPGVQIQTTPEEARAYYDSHKKEFATGELRKVQYLWISHESEKNRIQIPESKLQEYYKSNQSKYARPEQVHARHILLKTEGKNEEDVRKQAEDLVRLLRAGGDFTKIAREHSEDPGSKENGGDLGFFERGRMVPEFEQVAFSLKPNEISDPVKTQFGYHIIQVLQKQPAYQMDFALVKDQIYRELSLPQAIKNAQDQANKIYDEITKTKKSLADISKIQLVELRTTDYFSENQDLPDLGPAFRARAFELKKGEIGKPVQVFQDYAVPQLLDTKPSEVPPFEKVQEKVMQKVRNQKLEEISQQKAQKFAESTAVIPDLKAPAEKENLTVKSSDSFAKGGYIGEIGAVPEISDAAFAMSVHQISKPVKTPRGYIVFQLMEKKEYNQADFDKQKDQIRRQLLSDRESEFLQAYQAQLRRNYEKQIWINQEAVSPRET